ncbi:hypothetical protein NXX64_00020 [Bacteroides fragilis]|nr:hypothetical protein [Bacteroides fragilis]
MKYMAADMTDGNEKYYMRRIEKMSIKENPRKLNFWKADYNFLKDWYVQTDNYFPRTKRGNAS